MFGAGKSGRSLQHATHSRVYTCMHLFVGACCRSGVVSVAVVCLHDSEIQDSLRWLRTGFRETCFPESLLFPFVPGLGMRFHSLFLVTFYSKPDAAHVPYFYAWRMHLSQGCFHHLLREGILAVCDVREALEPPGLPRGFGPLGSMVLPASLAGNRMMMTSVDTISKHVASNRLGGAWGGESSEHDLPISEGGTSSQFQACK